MSENDKGVIDKIILYLEEIKNSTTNDITINYIPEILEIGTTGDGTIWGKKHLNIDILFEQLLYNKNDDNGIGVWEIYDKNK